MFNREVGCPWPQRHGGEILDGTISCSESRSISAGNKGSWVATSSQLVRFASGMYFGIWVVSRRSWGLRSGTESALSSSASAAVGAVERRSQRDQDQ
jgi:hypothetical protein